MRDNLWSAPFQAAPLKVVVGVAFRRREKRSKCSTCGMYRVVFYLESSMGEMSDFICARCGGLR